MQSGGQDNQEGFNENRQLGNDEQFFNDDNRQRQDHIILQDYTKNVSSRPSNSNHVYVSLTKHIFHQDLKDIKNELNQPLAQEDQLQQEAVPQFSTNPDQNQENPLQANQNNQNQPPLFPDSNRGKGLVTALGRQLSGNVDLDLNFKKKGQVFQIKKGSYGGGSELESGPRPNEGVQNNGAINPFKDNYHKEFTQNSNKKSTLNFQKISSGPGYAQQRTINLNFLDDLQIGIESEDHKLNYDVEEVDQAEKVFQDPNISVIHRNPKGSEFIDQDIEDEDNKMYESKELSSPYLMDLNSKERYTNPNAEGRSSTRVQSPIINQESLNSRFRNKARNSEDRRPNKQRNKNYNNQESEVGPRNNLLLDQNNLIENGPIIYKSQGTKNSMQTQIDYNTNAQESEADQFIPRLNLIGRKPEEDKGLLQPKAKPGNHHQHKKSADNSRASSPKNSFRNQNLKHNNSKALNVSKFSNKSKRLLQMKDSILIPVENKQDESEIITRFNQDYNERPQLDDKRSRMLIINKLQEAKMQGKKSNSGNVSKDNSFFMIVDKPPIEKIEGFTGRFSRVTRLLCRIRINVQSTAHYIISSKVFEGISILVIVANSVSLAIEDPTSTDSPFYQEVMDNLFLALYSLEMVLKILGLGFLFNKGAYLRDAWNILDFIIVCTGYLQLMFTGASFNISGLRSFRVLRPLRSIQRIEGLKLIVSALLGSLHLLRDTIIILLFFFFIFAIAGLQLFQGVMKKRCISIETGLPHPDDDFCGYQDCDPGYFCGKRNNNPNFDQCSFDTILYSLMLVFFAVTLESWSNVMQYVQASYTMYAFAYMIPLVFIGAFFLLNLTLAVIQSKYQDEHEKKKKEKEENRLKFQKKKGQVLDFDNLDEEEKQKLINNQMEARNNVLKKWKLILFIKTRMRRHVKHFQVSKSRRELKRQQKLAREKASLKHGLQDYGTIFCADFLNTVGGGTDNGNGDVYISNQDLNRDPNTFTQRTDGGENEPQNINLEPLDEKLKSKTGSMKQSKANGLQNFRTLNQEAIVEEDDEYKTEFSHIIGQGGLVHLSSGGIGKALRGGGSAGSRGTPVSPTQMENLGSVRRNSSRQQFMVQGLSFQKNDQEERIALYSPERKQINLIGMVGMKKDKKPRKRDSSNQQRNRRRKSSAKIDHEFFQDFINQDLDFLEQNFTEDDLIDIAQQVNDPQNYQNGEFDQITERDDEFSDLSIMTDDYFNRKHHLEPQASNFNRSNSEEQEDRNNNTPFTSTTGNFLHRQKSKLTQPNLLSQDLSISSEEDFEFQRNFQTQNDEEDKKISPHTFREQSSNEANTKSGDLPYTKKITDLKSLGNNDTQISKAMTVDHNQQDNGYKKKKPKPISTNKINESPPLQNQNTSFTMVTSQTGTQFNDNKTLHKEFKTFQSNKIRPIGPGSYYQDDDNPPKPRHGPNTVFNADYIPIDRSVLNSRFLVSDFIGKNQKVHLRRDKFEFMSGEDIFEQREITKKKFQVEENRRKATEYERNWKIKPYQRKQILTAKEYKPDDEMVEYLTMLEMDATELEKLIQSRYDSAYFSNQYVTGTLSICISDKVDKTTHKTRKIQDFELKSFQEDMHLNELSASINMNMNPYSGYPNPNSASSSNIFTQQYSRQNSDSPTKRAKTFGSQRATLKMLDGEQATKALASNRIFIKNQQSRVISRSLKRMKTAGALGLIEGKHRRNNDLESSQKTAARRREALLSKQAAKDANLQRKLILTEMTKDAYRSNKFRYVLFKRKVRMTNEEKQNKRIMEIYDMYKDENGEGDDDDDEESTDEDEIKDDFLDWPIDFKAEILKGKKLAAFEKSTDYYWSGQDVLIDFDPSHARKACSLISGARVWPQTYYGLYKRFQCVIKDFVKSSFFDNLMTMSVAVNTIALALDRHNIDPVESENLVLMNSIFTYIFICEMSFKIIGLGLIKYLKDKMNYLDGVVVILSIIEMVIVSGSKGGALSAFKAVRIFRIFRVLRVARLLKSMKSMQVIISVLMRSMSSFIYLFSLLMLFLFIYSLLGMQLFGGQLEFEENFAGPTGIPRTNFNNIQTAFYTAFQILTMENWPYLLYDALRSDVNQIVSILYFVSWIFLGNYMLLNLFLAILLDSFTDETIHIKKDEDPEVIKQKHFMELSKKEGEVLIQYYSEIKDEGDKKGSAKGGISKKKRRKRTKADDNMLDESFEFDKDFLTTKQMVVTKKRKRDFEGVECSNSFYIFKKTNKLRLYLYRAATHTAFEGVILVLIVLSSIKLVVDTYLSDLEEDSPIKTVSSNIDLFFTAAFAMESTIKMISFGVMQDKGSYLRETWSQLDFFIVATSLIDASFENINLPIIKILRILRTLRPLRFISHNSGMKTIVIALLQSFGGIVNVGIVIMTIWLMFAILAVNLFAGTLQYCSINTYKVSTKEECLKQRGVWRNQDYNFDSVPDAMLLLFSLATEENWPDFMYNQINAVGADLGPKLLYSPNSGFFFIVFILIGNFLFMNLFVGVIFKEFEDAQTEERASLMLKENQEKWVDMMRMIVSTTPDLETTNVPKSKWRQFVHGFVTGFDKPTNFFDIFIMIIIVLNMLQMAVNFEGQSAKYSAALDTINYVFTTIFALEALLKLVAFGFSYFKTSWNVFDFCVVCASMFDIVMNQLSSTSLKFLRVGPQLARVFRVLRVSRLFRLLNKYKGLQALLQTIQFSLPSVFNVFSLLMLVYFIFAILGTFLFRTITKGNIIDEYFNFSNFGMSMLMVIKMSTGEDWNYVMFDTMRTEEDNCIPDVTCGFSYSPIFFVPFMSITSFVMLELFVLVIIQQFNTYYLDDNNVINTFKADLEFFKKTWTKYTKDHNCLKIKDTKLVGFFANMEGNLGMKTETQSEIIKHVMGMDLISDNEGFVYFNELLFKSMRQVYGERHVKNKILIQHELNAMRKIENIKQKMIKKSRVQERLQAGQVNPFMLQLYMNASFRAWTKIYKQNKEKREKEIEDKAEKYAYNSEESSEYIVKGSRSKKKEEEDWEYFVEQDIEINDSEFLEEDEEEMGSQGSQQDQEGSDYDNEIDSSRMLQPNKNEINISILKDRKEREANSSLIIHDRNSKEMQNFQLKNISQPISPGLGQRKSLLKQEESKSESKKSKNSRDQYKKDHVLISNRSGSGSRGQTIEQKLDEDSLENSLNIRNLGNVDSSDLVALKINIQDQESQITKKQ